jgi:hypothetical protein
MNSFIKKIITFFTPEKFTEVYNKSGTWKIKYSNSDTFFDEYCYFSIHKSNKGHYKLTTSGHNPKSHNLYPEVFKFYRKLDEGKYYVSGGELFVKDENLTIEECEEKLKEAIQKEDYILAEKIRKIIENKNK